MTLAPAGDTGRREGPRPGGRPSGPPLGWEKVCVRAGGTCAERKVRAGPRGARTTKISAGLQAARPSLGSGVGEVLAPGRTCFAQRLMEQAFPQRGQLSRRSSCYWYPSAREPGAVGC